MTIINRQVIAVMGPPSSGKNKVQELLVKAKVGYGIGMSNALRDYAQAKPDARESIKRSAAHGQLVQDDLVIAAFERAIRTATNLNGDNVITEGVFRTRKQFTDVFGFLERHWADEEFGTTFVFLEASDEYCCRRFRERMSKESRPDNDPEVFDGRLRNYRELESELRSVAESYGGIVTLDGEEALPLKAARFLKSVFLGLDSNEKDFLLAEAVRMERRLQVA